MDLINYSDFQELLTSLLGKYYESRWAYFSEVINIIQKNEGISKVLELGPAFQTIVKNCDNIVKPENDAWGRPQNMFQKSMNMMRQ